MSISSAVRASLRTPAVDKARDDAPASVRAAAKASGKRELDTALERISAFIPSEVIASYTFFLGIIRPVSPNAKWVLFGIAVLLIPIFIAVSRAEFKRSRPSDKPPSGSAFLLFVFALLAFTAWAAALPDSPFLALSDMANQIGACCVFVFALLLPNLAKLSGLVV
jgi:hypothetical protein